MFATEELNKRYDLLAKLSNPLKPAEREIVGREYEMTQLMAALSRPELCNPCLLAEAGTGKTALVQGAMAIDSTRTYLDVDPSKMIAEAGDGQRMASMLKGFFDQAEAYVRDEGTELVLFIDEFHQIVQLSDAAVEAIKPVLAASGARGMRIIAATTYEEFHKHISPNQPLVERLQRINLSPPDEETTVKILWGMAERYGVAEEFYDDHILRLIYEYTQRYMPASSQPRKSILVLDSMVGWHRVTERPLDKALLADVLMESIGVNVAFRVDGSKIKRQLDAKVFSQDYATDAVARRLQLSVADLHDKSRPMASFLFTGSTGVGKGTLVSEQIPTIADDGRTTWKKAGDLVAGDQVFGRHGQPEEVLGVFPQGLKDVYRVGLSDGRSLVTDGPHLWGVYPFKKDRSRGLTVLSTETLALRLAEGEGRATKKARYSIPMNEAVQWPERELSVDPYVMGVLIADGCLTASAKPLVLSSDDEFIVAKVAEKIGAVGYDRVGRVRRRADGSLRPTNYNWYFASGGKARRGVARVQKADVIGEFPEIMDRYSTQRRIPEAYLTASIEQRWSLVKGLFDSDGHIGGKDGGRFNVSYSTSSLGLAEDVRHLLLSLGVTAKISHSDRDNGQGSVSREFSVHVRSSNQTKDRFFSLPRKLEIAARASEVVREKTFDFDYVDIVSVDKLEQQAETVCIYVADDEHLYQAGDFVVTHNTELTKQLANLLFGDDQRHLIRFDMSEYASEETFVVFREELTRRVWDRSHAVLLFDEIEKASSMVTRLLLQVLDDGRLSDANNREVSFLNTYIVLTTNAGSEIYKRIAEYEVDETGSGKALLEYQKLIEQSIKTTTGGNRFPQELLGRFDVIVPFQPLSRQTQKKIIHNKLRQLVKEVAVRHNVRITMAPRVLDYLAEDKADTDSDAGGARDAVRKLTNEVTTAVATYINEHPNERQIGVDISGVLVSEDKRRRTSDAHVVVRSLRTMR